MELTIFTDGGSLNNPGQAASAYLIYQNGKLIHKQGVALGIATNNEAEYNALIFALEKVHELLTNHVIKATSIQVFSDSALMVNQINGLFKVKHAVMREKIIKIRVLEGEINLPTKYTHVLREKNVEADALVKATLGR